MQILTEWTFSSSGGFSISWPFFLVVLTFGWRLCQCKSLGMSSKLRVLSEWSHEAAILNVLSSGLSSRRVEKNKSNWIFFPPFHGKLLVCQKIYCFWGHFLLTNCWWMMLWTYQQTLFLFSFLTQMHLFFLHFSILLGLTPEWACVCVGFTIGSFDYFILCYVF